MRQVATTALSTVILLAGMGAASAQTNFITITSGGTGGSWYPLAGAMAEVLNETLDDINVTATPGGSAGNVRDVRDGVAEIGFVFSTDPFAAWDNVEPFDDGSYDDVNVMFSMFPLFFQMGVPASSDIHSVEDLEGARLSPGQVGFGGEILTQILLDAHGLSYDAVEAAGGQINYTSSGEAVDLIKDGHLDWHGSITFAPAAFFMDLASTQPIRLLPIADDKLEAVMAEYPAYFVTELPGGLYDGQDEPVDVLTVATGLIVNGDVDEDLVYDITRALLENRDRLASVHASAEGITVETAMDGFDGAPFHPGAERYFREVGLIE